MTGVQSGLIKAVSKVVCGVGRLGNRFTFTKYRAGQRLQGEGLCGLCPIPVPLVGFCWHNHSLEKFGGLHGWLLK